MAWCRDCGAEEPYVSYTAEVRETQWGTAYYYHDGDDVVLDFTECDDSEQHSWEVEHYECGECGCREGSISDLLTTECPIEDEESDEEIEVDKLVGMLVGISGFKEIGKKDITELEPGDIYTFALLDNQVHQIVMLDKKAMKITYRSYQISTGAFMAEHTTNAGTSFKLKGSYTATMFVPVYEETEIEEPVRLADFIHAES